MQENRNFLPMVQDYIRENMPNGGYQIVSKRLEKQGIKLSGMALLVEVRTLKKNPALPAIKECVLFFKENNVPLDQYCEDFIRKEEKK